MGHFYVLLGLGGLVLLAFLWSLLKSFRGHRRYPYVLDPSLLTASERALMEILERVLGERYRVHVKVRASDVIDLAPRLSRRERERAHERLADHRFDFLICDRESSAMRCAVNLAPRSRLRKEPGRNALDRICEAVGLPLVRLRESTDYSAVEIEERVKGALRRRAVRHLEDRLDPEDEAAVLDELSRSLGGELAASRERPTRLSLVKASRSAADAGEAPRAPRLEPVIADQRILDDEPVFRIDANLEDDERPSRGSRH